MGGTRRVGIVVVSRVKSIELPTSESNGLIKTTPNETQKGLCYVCPLRCGPCLCSTVEMCSALLLQGGSHILHQLL